MGLNSTRRSPTLAANVHSSERGRVPIGTAASPTSMMREYQIRFAAGFLALLTVASVTLAWINFRKGTQFVAPYDGVSWVERDGGIAADRVEANGPGARAGIEAGDRLVEVEGQPVSRSEERRVGKECRDRGSAYE